MSNDKLEGFRKEDEVDDGGNKIERAPDAPDLEAGADPEGEKDAPAEQQAAEPQEREDPTEKIKKRAFKDDARAAIAVRHAEQRRQQKQADREAIGEEQSDLLDEVARGEQARIERMEREARGESDEDVVDDTQDEHVEGDPKTGDDEEDIASRKKKWKLRVYGKDEELTEDEVLRYAQIGRAGEVRLEDVATREAQLNEWEDSLKDYADLLRQERAKLDEARKATAGQQSTQQPPTGAAGQEVAALRRQAGEALLRGDDDAYARLSAEADDKLMQLAAARLKPQEPEEEPSSEGAVPELPARPQPSRYNRVAAINDAFARDYQDLLEDDVTFYAARAMMAERLEDPKYGSWSPEALAKEVGDAIKQKVSRQAPASQSKEPTGVQQELESRRKLKAQIPITPPAGSRRAPSGAPGAPSYQSRKEYVAELRRQRGLAP